MHKSYTAPARLDRWHELTVLKHLRKNFTAHTIEGGLFMVGMAFVAGTTVLTVIIKEMGGPDWLIALMPIMMSLGMIIPQLGVAHLVEQMPRHKPIVVLGGVLLRIPYLLCGLFLIFAAKDRPILAIISVALCPFISGLTNGISVTAWQELIIKTIPPKRRASLWAARNIIGSLGGLAAGSAVVHVLSRWPGVVGYGVLHLIAFGFLLISLILFVRFVHEIPYPKPPNPHSVGMMQNLRAIPALIGNDRRMKLFLLNAFFWSGIFILLPFVSIHALAQMNKPVSFVGYLVTAQMAGQIIGNLLAGWMGDRTGGKIPMVLGRFGFLAISLWAIVAQSPWEFLTIFVVMGFSIMCDHVGGSTLGMEICPPQKRASRLAVMAIITIGSMLIASQVSSIVFWLSSQNFSIVAMITSGCVLASLLTLTGIRDPRQDAVSVVK